MESEVRLRIVLEAPPPGVDFGLQKGRGSAYQTIHRQTSVGEDLIFDFAVRVKAGCADFQGPLVQGPPGARFVYIGIGTHAGQVNSCWSRRLKVPLIGIAQEMLDGSVLEARVPGTGKDGGPTCATVKPFGGWKRSA